MNHLQPPINPPAEAMHLWFGLSYANYLTLPRSVIQSMPDEWQAKLAALLAESDRQLLKRGIQWPPDGCRIHVELRTHADEREPRIVDELADYERGRRRLWQEDGTAT